MQEGNTLSVSLLPKPAEPKPQTSYTHVLYPSEALVGLKKHLDSLFPTRFKTLETHLGMFSENPNKYIEVFCGLAQFFNSTLRDSMLIL